MLEVGGVKEQFEKRIRRTNMNERKRERERGEQGV